MIALSEMDKRTVVDRRQTPTKPLSRYMFCGRRQSIRRRDDRKRHVYVDRYDTKLLVYMLLIILLSVLDACFTIYHLSRGAKEINPLMDTLIKQG
jgi:hypothetical protein